jgi:mutator protein MutT
MLQYDHTSQEKGGVVRAYPQAPVAAVGVIIEDDQGNILLIRRANEPDQGRWSVPGGAVELGETTIHAASREVREECGVAVQMGPVVSVYDLIEPDRVGEIRFHYVIIHYLARYQTDSPRAASDSLYVEWVPADAIPDLDMSDRLKAVIAKAREISRDDADTYRIQDQA